MGDAHSVSDSTLVDERLLLISGPSFMCNPKLANNSSYITSNIQVYGAWYAYDEMCIINDYAYESTRIILVSIYFRVERYM